MGAINNGRINLIDVTVNGDIHSTASGVINTAGNVTFNGSITGGASVLEIGGGLTASMPGGGQSVSVVSLSLTGNLDLADNRMVLTNASAGAWNGTNYTGTSGQVKSGRNGGAWNGSGIVTSMSDAPQSTGLTTLAVATAGRSARRPSAAYQSSRRDVLVMYTYDGDANLSGNIDGDDYFRIDAGFERHAPAARLRQRRFQLQREHRRG